MPRYSLATYRDWNKNEQGVLRTLTAWRNDPSQMAQEGNAYLNEAQQLAPRVANFNDLAVLPNMKKSNGEPLHWRTVDNYVVALRRAIEDVTGGQLSLVGKSALFPEDYSRRGKPRPVTEDMLALRKKLPAELTTGGYSETYWLIVVSVEQASLSPRDRQDKCLRQLGIIRIEERLGMMDFGQDAPSPNQIFILQNALPDFEQMSPLLAGHLGPVRIVIYDPDEKELLAARQREVPSMAENDPQWLYRRILRSIEAYVGAQGQRSPATNVQVRTTKTRLPFVLYGTSKQIFLGWLLPEHQSNDMPQLVVDSPGLLYVSLRSYFDHFWDNHSFPLAQKRSGQLLSKYYEELAKGFQNMEKLEIHVGIPKDRVVPYRKSLDKTSPGWSFREFESTEPGSADPAPRHKMEGSHEIDGGLGLLASLEVTEVKEAVSILNKIGGLLRGDVRPRIELERVLWESSEVQPIDFQEQVQEADLSRLGFLEAKNHGTAFEAHFTFTKTVGGGLDPKYVRELFDNLQTKCAELSWVKGRSKVIGTRFFESAEEMASACKDANNRIANHLEALNACKMRFKITAEQVLLCASPLPRKP